MQRGKKKTAKEYARERSRRRELKRQASGYYRSEVFREMRRRSGANTYKRRQRFLRRYAITHAREIAARSAIQQAVKSGLLIKPSVCENVGCSENTRIHAHHYKGYAEKNWLSVVWLCQEHHYQAHHGN